MRSVFLHQPVACGPASQHATRFVVLILSMSISKLPELRCYSLVLLSCVFGILTLGVTSSTTRSFTTQKISLDSMNGLKLVNVKVESANFRGRKALRVTDAAAANIGDEGRLVVLPQVEFQDGTIEVDLAGEPGPNAGEGARGFVGLAFRIAADESRFECIYLRPTNGRAEDQVRRNHSVQYISIPGFPWPLLRKEFPEKYESYVDLVAGEWTKVKIEVKGDKARLFVHDSPQPTLLVNDLKQGLSKGAIALWVGPGTIAYFSDLRITR